MKRLILAICLAASASSHAVAQDIRLSAVPSTTAGAISITGSVVVTQTGLGVRNLPIPELKVLMNVSPTSTQTIGSLVSNNVITLTGNFSTSLSSPLATLTTLIVPGNTTVTGTSALLGLVGVAGQPTTTAALHIASRSISGTNGYGFFSNATTGATNNYAGVFLGGALLVGTTQSSQTTGIITTGAYNTSIDYRISSQSVVGFSSNIVQLGNNSGWVGSSLFAGSTEMLRTTATSITLTGGLNLQLQAVTTSGSMSDSATIMTLTGGISRTLPSPASGRMVFVKNISAATCTVFPVSGTIDGASSVGISGTGGVILIGNGTNFLITGTR